MPSTSQRCRKISIRITVANWIVLAIREHIGAEDSVGIGGSEGVGVNEPAVGKVIVPALEVVETRFAVVVIATVAQRVDVPDEAGGSVLLSVFIVHGVVAPRAVGAAAQRNAADNDDDLWLCADGCTHHSDYLSIFYLSIGGVFMFAQFTMRSTTGKITVNING